LVPRDSVPLMLCERAPDGPTIPGLRIRTLAPEESGIHAAILAEAFGAPLALSVELTPPALLGPENVWALVGDAAGRPVTTAFVDLFDGVGHIHNVGTREAFRGRGFGTAISAAATRIAFAAGADLATLLSTPMGLGVYERIGFRTVEHWSVWESPEL
jgi:GNAT superfamily N-acetyltransferase